MRSFQFLYVVIISQNSGFLFVLVVFPKGRENLGLVLAFQIFPFYAGTMCPHVFRFEFQFFFVNTLFRLGFERCYLGSAVFTVFLCSLPHLLNLYSLV